MKLVKLRISLTIVIGLMLIETIYAQNTKKPDYLIEARSLIETKQFSQAFALLSGYISENQTDVEIIWLYAYSAHAVHKDDISEVNYEKALTILPDNNDLKMEFASMLFESGRLKKAESLLQSLYSLKDQKFEILYYLAYIDLWNGRYSSSREKISELRTVYIESPLIDELEAELKRIISPQITLNFSHLTDNQPLKADNFHLGFSRSFSAYFHPKAHFSYNSFLPVASTFQLDLGNSMNFPVAKISITANAGLYHNGFENSNHLIGQFSVNKKFGKNTDFELGYTRQPYLSTQKSTEYGLLNSNYFLNFEQGNAKSNLFHASASIVKWDDDNQIQSYSFWYLSKPFLKKSGFSLKMGSGIGYSDSKEIKYFPVGTDALTDTSVNYQVEGVYSPYYTPGRLTTLMGLINVNYSPVNKLNISLKGNAAIYGRADIPVIIKSYNEAGSPELNLYSYRSNVHPFDVSLNIDYFISPASSISIYGSYFDTYYYDSFKAGITLIKRF